MRRSVDADKLMDGLGRLATDTDLCKRYGNCTPWIPYSAVRKLISDMILEAKESCDDTVSRKAMLEKIRTMQTYKLFSCDDMILIDKAEVQTELMMLPPTESEPSQVARDIATILENEKDMRVIATQPEIVRCKDCKYMTEHYDADGNVPCWTCSEWDSGTDYDGFCHYAERQTDERLD